MNLEIVPVSTEPPKSIGLGQLIADGQYEYVDPYLNEKFFRREDGNPSEVFFLIGCNHVVSTKDVLDFIAKNNLAPANVFDLLSIGGQEKNPPNEWSIVALGSLHNVPHEDREAPILFCRNGKKQVVLESIEHKWSPRFKFLVKRQKN